MKHVVMFSGGLGSWAAAKRVAAAHGTDNLYLLFTDTLMEDDDLYRFISESIKKIGGKFVYLLEGRTPWEVFFDKRFLGNSLVDPCSRILKREMSKAWIEENCDPKETIIYLGIDWSEIHRYEKAKPKWLPYELEAPLCNAPYLSKEDIINLLKYDKIEPPRLYALGFPHNNCGGFCVKAGQKHFIHLLTTLPEVYQYHENKEEEIRQYLGKDVSIMREQIKGQRKNLTLRQLREQYQSGGKYDEQEWGGCGCFIDEPDTSIEILEEVDFAAKDQQP